MRRAGEVADRLLAAAAAATVLVAALAAVPPARASVPVAHVRADTMPALGRLSWLAGCWQWRAGSLAGDEQWMAPRGGMMLGMSRTLRDERVVEHESLRIEEQGDSLVLTAAPSRQAVASFRAVLVSDSSATFENPVHDFPQRIAYRRQGSDSLVATIGALAEGARKPIDFPMARVACP